MIEVNDAARRAEEAERILESPVFQEAFATLEIELMNVWRNSEVDDVHLRERLHVAINLLDGLKNEIRIAVENGEVLKHRLVRIKDWPLEIN